MQFADSTRKGSRDLAVSLKDKAASKRQTYRVANQRGRNYQEKELQKSVQGFL